eukprot:NODE_1994_length_521_cov_539.648305_g1627_i0.p1 GENE.NODE_1994_length_521_cov_539.648305_g1627_i0~~NODE_1994_length_521_cov_539.648305_g1627_i0.p1  ORF type:complete len:151 (-),score=32.92 NODE_1994_length_521_cov_539.648305_g1627_i0:69-491(-)
MGHCTKCKVRNGKTKGKCVGDMMQPDYSCSVCSHPFQCCCCNVPSNGRYILTTFDGSPGGSCGNCPSYSMYTADRQRWGCGTKIKVSANGKSVTATVCDAGPAAWVEKMHGAPVLDASASVCKALFGSSSCANWVTAHPV